MRVQSITLIILLVLLLSNCVPKYQRYIEGIYKGANPSELLRILDEQVKRNKFVFERTIEKSQEYAVIAVYNQPNENIHQDIRLIIFLKDTEGNDWTEFLITVNALGRENTTKMEVDKAFESLVSEIESRMEPSKFKILKKS